MGNKGDHFPDSHGSERDPLCVQPLVAPMLLQWHITAKCGNRCRHCYQYGELTYKEERHHPLSWDEMMRVLESVEEFERQYGARFSFGLIGGDPLLHERWEDLLRVLRPAERIVQIAGNPETLTEEAATRMAELGVRSFQLSLDGLEEMHDNFRSKGSFQRTIAKLDLLAQKGIDSAIMFTLFRSNAEDLIPLMRYLADHTNASTFAFDLGSHMGNAAQISERLTAAEFHGILSAFLDEKKRLEKQGSRLIIHEKPNLCRVARFEKGSYYPLAPAHVPALTGCPVGWTSISILSDGTVLACSRMGLKVGKMPEHSFEEIFLGSELLRKFRRPESFEGCGTCDFFRVCRGCPAHVWSVTGDPFAQNPICFRSDIARRTDEAERTPGPPLDITYAEEWKYITRRNSWGKQALDYLEEADFRRIYLSLASDATQRELFFRDPYAYTPENGSQLDQERNACLIHLLSSSMQGGINPFTDKVAKLAYSKFLADLI